MGLTGVKIALCVKNGYRVMMKQLAVPAAHTHIALDAYSSMKSLSQLIAKIVTCQCSRFFVMYVHRGVSRSNLAPPFICRTLLCLNRSHTETERETERDKETERERQREQASERARERGRRWEEAEMRGGWLT